MPFGLVSTRVSYYARITSSMASKVLLTSYHRTIICTFTFTLDVQRESKDYETCFSAMVCKTRHSAVRSGACNILSLVALWTPRGLDHFVRTFCHKVCPSRYKFQITMKVVLNLYLGNIGLRNLFVNLFPTIELYYDVRSELSPLQYSNRKPSVANNLKAFWSVIRARDSSGVNSPSCPTKQLPKGYKGSPRRGSTA